MTSSRAKGFFVPRQREAPAQEQTSAPTPVPPPVSGPRTLLVAATGGHLEQLFRIQQRLQPTCGPVEWVTHDDPQSRSLLAGHTVHHAPYVPPRGWREIIRNEPVARRTIRDGGFERLVTTGAGVALPYVAMARAAGIPCHYIESAARADGPSVTGRLVSRVPGVLLYSQYEAWSGSRWQYRGSLFDTFEPEQCPPPVIRKVVITLGTMRTYAFRSVVDSLLRTLPDVVTSDAEVLWQLGATPADGITGDVRPNLDNAELRSAIAAADLVVAHAGIGSALTALELGKRPLLVPRRSHRGEHVDDHQILIARELDRRGLAVMREADEIAVDDLIEAASAHVTTTDQPSPFVLLN